MSIAYTTYAGFGFIADPAAVLALEALSSRPFTRNYGVVDEGEAHYLLQSTFPGLLFLKCADQWSDSFPAQVLVVAAAGHADISGEPVAAPRQIKAPETGEAAQLARISSLLGLGEPGFVIGTWIS